MYSIQCFLQLARFRRHPTLLALPQLPALSFPVLRRTAPHPCRRSKDDTVILNGGGAKADIAERCDQIRQSMEASTSDYDREKLQERLAKLSGGVAVLKVRGRAGTEHGVGGGV